MSEDHWRGVARAIVGPEIRKVLDPQVYARSCLSCVNWTGEHEPKYACRAFKLQCPDPRTIVYGCKEYFDVDEIPF